MREFSSLGCKRPFTTKTEDGRAAVVYFCRVSKPHDENAPKEGESILLDGNEVTVDHVSPVLHAMDPPKPTGEYGIRVLGDEIMPPVLTLEDMIYHIMSSELCRERGYGAAPRWLTASDEHRAECKEKAGGLLRSWSEGELSAWRARLDIEPKAKP